MNEMINIEEAIAKMERENDYLNKLRARAHSMLNVGGWKGSAAVWPVLQACDFRRQELDNQYNNLIASWNYHSLWKSFE